MEGGSTLSWGRTAPSPFLSLERWLNNQCDKCENVIKYQVLLEFPQEPGEVPRGEEEAGSPRERQENGLLNRHKLPWDLPRSPVRKTGDRASAPQGSRLGERDRPGQRDPEAAPDGWATQLMSPWDENRGPARVWSPCCCVRGLGSATTVGPRPLQPRGTTGCQFLVQVSAVSWGCVQSPSLDPQGSQVIGKALR